jgi:PAS domain S-box-containing protein
MSPGNDEEALLRSVALQNAQSILLARQRAEEELVRAKDALELRTQELAHSLAMMRATLEASTDGILVTDDDGTVTGFNEKFVQMWRIPREILDVRKHRRLLEVTCHAFEDPRQFLARIDEIYAASPPESYDLLELADGGVFERVSRIQVVEERNVGRVWSFRDITDRKRAEDALRESAQQLRLITDTAPAFIAYWDAALRLRFVNQSYAERFGLEPREAVGRSAVEFLGEEGYAAIKDKLAGALAGERVEFDVEISYPTVGARVMHSSYAPDVGERGEVRGIVAVIHDVTDRKLAETTLAERARLAELAADVGNALTQSANLGPMLQRCCEAMVRHLGAAFARIWTLDEGGSILELRASAGMYTHLDGPHGRVPVGKYKIGTIAAERTPHLTNSVVGDPAVSDQEWARREQMVSFAGYPLVVEGRLIGVMGMFSRERLTDVTIDAMASIANGIALGIERVRSQQAREHLLAELERERARLEEETHTLETINRMSEAIAAELNLDRLVQTLTDEATKLTGAHFGSFFYNVTGEQGESFMLYTIAGVPRELFAGFPMPRNTPIFDPTFRGEGIVRIDDVTKDPRYGKNPPYNGMPEGHLPVRSYLAVPVVLRSGQVIGGLFFGHPDAGVFTASNERVIAGIAAQAAIAVDNARLFDALEREKDTAESARARAEAANRAKDEFLAMVSHELRTPLNSMLGWMRLIRSGRLDEETLARGLETIERNTLSQAQLIEDLLDISRVITGKLSLVVEQVEIESVIQTAVDSIRLAAESKNLRLQMILDSSAGMVLGDRGRLQQIVWNLLTNAIKFTPKGGTVRVQLERVDSSVQITVTDTGKGISGEFLPYVFDRFRQADAGSTRAHGGLGLGLSIVRHLVELHGGTVRADSDGEGTGATFVVRLPVAPVRREAVKAPDPPRTAAAVGAFACPPELAGVCVLVVDDEADTREMLAVVLGQCEADVHTAASADEALAVLDGRDGWRPDLLVSDIGMPEEDGYSLIKKVRQRPTERGGGIPAVALTAYARLEDRMQALAAGFQMHVAKPVEPAELILVIHSLLEFKGRT